MEILVVETINCQIKSDERDSKCIRREVHQLTLFQTLEN